MAELASSRQLKNEKWPRGKDPSYMHTYSESLKYPTKLPNLMFMASIPSSVYATQPVDASIFTVAQLRFYLKRNQVHYSNGCRQPGLLKLYDQHLADRFRPEEQRFDWPAPSDLNVPGLKHILTEHKVGYDSGARRNVLEQLYDDLKIRLQGQGENSEEPIRSVTQKTNRGKEKWTPRKRSRIQKKAPVRARPIWLVDRHAKKKKNLKQVETQPTIRPIRRSARISTKAGGNVLELSGRKTLTEAEHYESDVKKHTITIQDQCYPSKRPRIPKVKPVRPRPLWIRKRKSVLAKPQHLHQDQPPSIENPGIATAFPLIDFTCSVPVKQAPSNENVPLHLKLNSTVFPLIDYTNGGSINVSKARLNPLLEMIPSSDVGVDLLGAEPFFLNSDLSSLNVLQNTLINMSKARLNPLLEMIRSSDAGVDLLGEEPLILNSELSSLVLQNTGIVGPLNNPPLAEDVINNQPAQSPAIVRNLTDDTVLTQKITATSKDQQVEKGVASTSLSVSTASSCPDYLEGLSPTLDNHQIVNNLSNKEQLQSCHWPPPSCSATLELQLSPAQETIDHPHPLIDININNPLSSFHSPPPSHSAIPRISDAAALALYTPPSPAYAQVSESSLEYLSETSQTDRADNVPGTTSKVSDPVFQVTDHKRKTLVPSTEPHINQPATALQPSPQSPEINIASGSPSVAPTSPARPDQQLELSLPSLEHLINHPAKAPEPTIQSPQINIASGSLLVAPIPPASPSVEQTSPASPSAEQTPPASPSVEQTPPASPSVEQTPPASPSVEKTPPVSPSVEQTPSPSVEQNPPASPSVEQTSPISMAYSPIHKRPWRRVIHDSDDDNNVPVPPVAPACFATNAPPTAVIPATTNLPPANDHNPMGATAGGTHPHIADPEVVDTTSNNNVTCDWPDPDGKVTAAQIKPILKSNGVYCKSGDSKLALLAKYKLLFSEKQGKAPLYGLRPRPAQAPHTAAKTQQSIKAPPATDLPVSEEETHPMGILPNGDVQCGSPRPQSYPNAEMKNINPLIDMDDSSYIHGSAMSIQPINPTIAQRSERWGSPRSNREEPVQHHIPSWASDVLRANMENDNSATSQSIEALILSLNSFAQTSIHIGNASLNTMKVIAEGFTNLNRAIGAIPPDSLFNMSSPVSRPPAARYSRHSRSRPLSDDMDLDTPTTQPRAKCINVEVQAAVRQHCAMMFGRCAKDENFPPPATADERRLWVRKSRTDSSDGESNDGSTTSTSSAMEVDEDADPDFPYLDGPGHSAASPEALSIVWRAMSKAGVKSFRPDLSKRMTHSVNCFLWDLAKKTFIRLVKSNEYEALTSEVIDQVDIDQYFTTHVQSTLMRRYRENKKLTPEQLARRQKKKRKNTRLATLKRWRLEDVVSHPTLIGLVPVIEHCCSDDETDNEADPSLLRRGLPMRAVVHKVPWRSARVERIMIALDRLRARRLEYATQKPNTPPPRVRRRLQQPQISSLPYKEGLPVAFYDESWLRSLSTYKLQALNSKIDGPPLDYYIGLVERIIH